MNQIVEYPLPVWIQVLFLAAIPAPIMLTIKLASRVFQRSGLTARTQYVSLFFLAYVAYVGVLGYMGAYKAVSFPPKVLILTTFPLATFLFLYVARTGWYRKFVENVALAELVQWHIFRLIGGFFLLLAYHDALPAWFAIVAGSGDILTAFTSLLLAGSIRKKIPGYVTWTWVWNTFGLVDILFTAISANIITKFSIDNGTMGVDSLAAFPFFFIPALAPPLIVFLHYTTYLKLKKKPGSIS